MIDTHSHIQFPVYDGDRKEVIARAATGGVSMLAVGTQKDTSRRAVEVAREFPGSVWASVGLHPLHTERSYHDKKELGEGGDRDGFTSRGETFDYDFYKNLGEDEKVVAIGECGLDYYRLGEETKRVQKEVFLKQILLAGELKKPLIIHCRSAFSDLIDVLVACRNSLVANCLGVIHFFSGTSDDARKLTDLGFYIAFGGVITFAKEYEEVVKFVPMDKIVLETDAPYVAPVPYRGKRNEPAYIIETAKKIAEIKNLPVEEVTLQTTLNAKKLFRLT